MTLTLKKICCLAALCLCADVSFSACALARTTDEIAKIFNAGIVDYDQGNYEQAYRLWYSIDDEDVAAMRNLGILLRRGQGVKKDPGRAEEMFQRAADAGLATAQADLADMLLRGEAGKPDPKRALPLLKAAAAANHPIAEYELAQMYESGGLVPRDLDAARNLYTEASRHGMKEAADRLAVLGPPDKRLVAASSLSSNTASSVNVLASLGPAPSFPSLTGPSPTLAGSAGPPAAGSATAGAGVYSAQIGAFKDRASAEAARDKYRKTFAAQLGQQAFDIQAADLQDKGTWYRLRVAGFDDRAAASAFCQNFGATIFKCFTTREARDQSASAAAP